MEAALEPDGFNLINACRPAAWQTVFHFHIHVIPRYDDDPLKLPWIPRGADADDDRRHGRAGSAATERVSAQVRLERDGAVASIVLDNPPLNLFGEQVFTDLVACIDEVEAADDVRCVVWRAAGDIFSGGVDVNVFQKLVEADEDGSRRSGSCSARFAGSRPCRCRLSP